MERLQSECAGSSKFNHLGLVLETLAKVGRRVNLVEGIDKESGLPWSKAILAVTHIEVKGTTWVVGCTF